jgi:hypothetical protein
VEKQEVEEHELEIYVEMGDGLEKVDDIDEKYMEVAEVS